MKINFDEFEVIVPVTRKQSKQVVSVFADGSFSVNGELVKVMKTNQFEVYLDKKDYCRMLLVPGGKIITDMGKNNRIKNYAISEKLTQKKVTFPAYYSGRWDDDNKCWIGDLVRSNPNKTRISVKK